MRENPFSLATLTHWLALRAVGLNTEGSARPVPHSESVKVLGPKCMNMAISENCHESCCEVGMGRIGIGGGFGCEEEEENEAENWVSGNMVKSF